MSDRLEELAKLIHRTAEGQGWGCYHPAPGMAACVGMARAILTHFKREENVGWKKEENNANHTGCH